MGAEILEKEYTYAVARIRVKENSLLSQSDTDALLSAKTVSDCIRLLNDKGWAECRNDDFEKMLSDEEDKLWKLINELIEDDALFNAFRYDIDFHNVKAAIKAVFSGKENLKMFFLDRGTVKPEIIYKAVKEKDFQSLPEHISSCADEAFHKLIQTGDGQLCDILIDKKSLECIFDTASKSKCDLLKLYAELKVASADIKIAVRCFRTGKKLDFIKSALAECNTLNISLLAEAASKSFEDICDFLLFTDYSDAVEYLKKSSSELERYFDNIIMEAARQQKFNSFTAAPVIAYYLARKNEFKTVRIILSGKQNGLSEKNIKDRLRDMYV